MSEFKKIRRKLMRPFEAFPVYVLLFSVKLLTLQGARRLGRLLGLLIYLVPAQRKLALKNIEVAFPQKKMSDKKRIVKKSMQNLAMVFIEFMWFYKRPQRLKKYVKISAEVKKAYLAQKDPEKPMILLAMHWGNWEISPRSFKMIDDVAISMVARKLKNPYLEKIMTTGREGKDLVVIHEKGAVRAIVKALKNKLSVGMLVDQNTKTHEGGIFAKFFGLPVTISKTPASLARRTNTMILMVNCKRTTDGFEICLKHTPKNIAAYQSDQELSEDILNMMEEFVREDPEQWVWMYKRWNYIPLNWATQQKRYPDYAVVDKKLTYPL